MDTISLTNQQARRFLIAHQGLWPPYRQEGNDGILAYIRRVGCIQFDPLNIVGRNPDLVLQSRIAGYCPEVLNELLYEDRLLVDGWDKMMSIYSVSDWPYFHRYRHAAKAKILARTPEVESVLPEIRETIRDHGPLSSLELEHDQTVDWPWAPTRLARAALESMYSWGELIIHHRVHTRKYYDFAQRHLPQTLLEAAEPNPTEESYRQWRVLRRIGSIGLLWDKSGDGWLGISEIKSKQRKIALSALESQGKVMAVEVEGLNHQLYLRAADQPLLTKVLEDKPAPAGAAFLAPLDNMLWDRRLVKELFSFDYRWEVYKPARNRQYGYYVLPVLWGDRFVARFEPGWDKKKKALTIKGWWWEPDIVQDDSLQADLLDCFRRFLAYLEAHSLKISPSIARNSGLEWLKTARNQLV